MTPALHGRRHAAQLLLPVPRIRPRLRAPAAGGGGLCWRFEQTEDGPELVLFADSTQPERGARRRQQRARWRHPLSRRQRRRDPGHGAGAAGHAQPARLARHGAELRLQGQAEHRSERAVACALWTQPAGAGILRAPGQYAYANRARPSATPTCAWRAGKRARSCGRALDGAHPARGHVADGHRCAAGSFGDAPAFTVLRVTSVGVNNLPPPAHARAGGAVRADPELLEELHARAPSGGLCAGDRTGREVGLCQLFRGDAGRVPWRPALLEDESLMAGNATERVRRRKAPSWSAPTAATARTAPTSCTATARPRAHPLSLAGRRRRHLLGARRPALAGGGMGSQFLPRIGQEVLVQFIENDIDRPVIVGALVQRAGRGRHRADAGRRGCLRRAMPSCFAGARPRAFGQGNLAGGHSPCGMARRATAPGIATGRAVGHPQQGVWRLPATTSCCSTIPMRRGGCSCVHPCRDRAESGAPDPCRRQLSRQLPGTGR
jgi:type VI secretion system secreted protein VgrG